MTVIQSGIDWYGPDGNTQRGRKIDLDAAWRAGARTFHRKMIQLPWVDGDPGFIEDWQLLGESKLPLVRQFYVFPDFRPDAAKAATQIRAAAKLLARAGGMRPSDMAPAFDTEFGGRPPPQSPAAIARFREAIAQAMHDEWGCWPAEYSSARVVDGTDIDCLHGERSWTAERCTMWCKTGYRLGYNQPPDEHPPKGTPKMPRQWAAPGGAGAWLNQYQGEVIQFAGFLGKVDLNRFLYLRRGDVDPNRITWVQLGLLGWNRTPGSDARLTVSGLWDDATDRELRQFQRDNGLDADAIIGPRTFAFLSRLDRTYS